MVAKPLIFRRYQLQIDSSDRDRFVAEGVHNMTTSLAVEPGTLAMYATHLDVAGTNNFIFELYQNQAEYEVHANSSQFKQYGRLAQSVVQHKAVDDLQLQDASRSPETINVSGPNTKQMLMLDFKVAPDLRAHFTSALHDQCRVVSDQVQICYAATFVDNPNHWLLMLVFNDHQQLVRTAQSWSTWLNPYTSLVSEQVLKVDTMVVQADFSYK